MTRLMKAAPAAAIVLGMLSFAGAAAADGVENCLDASGLNAIECDEGPISYAAIRGGLASIGDADFILGGPGAGKGYASSEADYGLGFTAGGAIGYEFVEVRPGLDLRPELEIGYMQADLDSFSAAGGAGGPGEAGVMFGFLSLYGDVQIAPQWELVLGGGVGLGAVDFSGHGAPGLDVLDDGDVAVGYHLDFGLSYDIADDVSIDATYRFSSFLDVETTSGAGASNSTDIDSHQLLFGLRFKL